MEGAFANSIQCNSQNESQYIVLSLYQYGSLFFQKAANSIYLMNRKTGVDACSIDLFPLDIEPPDRWAHSLGTSSDHTDIFGEVEPKRLQVAQQEPMREAQYTVGLHVREYLLIVVSLNDMKTQ
jgi:hypothetical protein